MEALLFTLISGLLITASFTDFALVSIICFGLGQIISAWQCHSMAHSRNDNLYKLGKVIISLLRSSLHYLLA